MWYSPENFEESGYKAPETTEGLKVLTQRIADDGATPWRIGLGAGAAFGCPATDWVEEFVLRTQPPEVYDQRVAHEIPFDDPRIPVAAEEYGWFARTDDFTPQEASAVATTDFRNSPAGLFAFPPECYIHRQANFIPNFFTPEIKIGSDADFFYFPA